MTKMTIEEVVNKGYITDSGLAQQLIAGTLSLDDQIIKDHIQQTGTYMMIYCSNNETPVEEPVVEVPVEEPVVEVPVEEPESEVPVEEPVVEVPVEEPVVEVLVEEPEADPRDKTGIKDK
jgi:hypothetical protein